MSKIIIVKQKPVASQVLTGFAKETSYSRAVNFNAVHISTLKRERNSHIFITGLNELSPSVQAIEDPDVRAKRIQEIVETRNRLEKVTGYDLSPTSAFWKKFSIPLNYRDDVDYEMKWDLSNPDEEIKYIAALANKIVAPSKKALENDPFFDDQKVRFYLYNEVEEKAEKQKIVSLQRKLNTALGKLFSTGLTGGQTEDEDVFEVPFIYAKVMELNVNSGSTIDEIYTKFQMRFETYQDVAMLEKGISFLKKPLQEILFDFLFIRCREMNLLRYTNDAWVGFGISFNGAGKELKDALQLLPNNEGDKLVKDLMAKTLARTR